MEDSGLSDLQLQTAAAGLNEWVPCILDRLCLPFEVAMLSCNPTHILVSALYIENFADYNTSQKTCALMKI